MTDASGGLTRQQAAVMAFTVFALQSKEITATAARALDLAADELSMPVGAVLRLAGPCRASVLQARGRVRLPDGETFEADPEVLASEVSRHPLGLDVLAPHGVTEHGHDHDHDHDHEPDAGAWPASVGGSLSVLIVVEGAPWGRLLVSDDRPRSFDRADEDFLRVVASILGAALERARLDRGNAVLTGFTWFALVSPDDAAIAERAVDAVKEVADAPIGALVKIVPDRGEALTLVQSPEQAGGGCAIDDDPELIETLLRPGPLVIEDARTDVRFAGWPLPPTGRPVAYLAPALRVDGRIWGRLVAGDTSPRRFSAREIELAQSIANVLAAALQNDLSDPARRAGALRVAQRRRADRDQTEVALLDPSGVIVWVNRAWLDFCQANGGDALRTGVGTSYLASCEAADDAPSRDVAAAIRTAAAGGLPAPMRIVIPCHSPRTARWYDVLISSRLGDDGACLGSTVTLSPAE